MLALFAATALAACSDAAEPDHGDEHEESSSDEHGEHGEHEDNDEAVAVLTEAQVASSGIHVQRAEPGLVPRHLTLSAVVVENADAVAHVNPKAPGIVRSIRKQLGDEVREGELLAVIDSVELGEAVAEYVRARALVEAAETTLEREGQLFAERLATTERVLDGAIDINRVIYEREKDLQERAVSTMRPLLEADRALQGAELEKERQLTELGAARDSRILELEVGVRERRILADAARNRLVSLGTEAALLDELTPGSPLLAGTYEIRAPRAGIVSGRHISTGEYVDAATKLYTLQDLSRVWIVASAFEQQVRSVRTGQDASIRLDAFPGMLFEGRVTLIGYEVDAETRSLGVRVELDNPELEAWPEGFPLRPGMFGRVDLVVERTQARVALPESAVVHDDAGDFVFVATSPTTFERRPVELGAASGELVEVLSGVEPGESVAIRGTFQLKSVLRKSELGEGHSH